MLLTVSPYTMAESYYVYDNRTFSRTPLDKLAERLGLNKGVTNISDYDNTGWNPDLWSARLSTGLFGLASCPSGNKEGVPKGPNEVILAVGDEGLQKILELGFITCPVCKPEQVAGFWEKAKETVRELYGISQLANFINKTVIPYNVTRLDFETIIPTIDAVPNRFYVPRDISYQQRRILKHRFENMGYALPPIGYYDREAPGHFRELAID